MCEKMGSWILKELGGGMRENDDHNMYFEIVKYLVRISYKINFTR